MTKSTKCRIYKANIEKYWDGDLDNDPSTAERLEDHVLECERCRRNFLIRRALEETPFEVWATQGVTRNNRMSAPKQLLLFV